MERHLIVRTTETGVDRLTFILAQSFPPYLHVVGALQIMNVNAGEENLIILGLLTSTISISPLLGQFGPTCRVTGVSKEEQMYTETS